MEEMLRHVTECLRNEDPTGYAKGKGAFLERFASLIENASFNDCLNVIKVLGKQDTETNNDGELMKEERMLFELITASEGKKDND